MIVAGVRRVLLSAGVFMLGVLACGPQVGSSQPAATPSSPLPVSSTGDWEFERMFNDPLPPGEEKSSVEDAQREAPFAILTPSLGDPLHVWISKVAYQGKGGAAVALTYDSASFGRIVIMETLDPVDLTTSEKWESDAAEAVAANGKPGHYGSSERVAVRGGQGLLGVHPSGRIGLAVFEGGILVQIFGPDLSKDQAVAIAEGMK